jgi:tight adherence protein B
MELTLSIVLLALSVALALMFYEHSRRAEVARSELLSRRIRGSFVPPAPAAAGKVQVGRLWSPVSSSTRSFLPVLERWLAQAGIGVPAEQFLGYGLLLCIIGAIIIALCVGLGAAGFYGVAVVILLSGYVVRQRKHRLSTFSQQLPYVLDFLRSALRAGHPLSRALQMSSETAPEPIASELRLALDQMRYGSTLPDALASMFERVPEQSLGFFVAAVRVQADIGSSIAEIIDRVADSIRDSQRLHQQLKALTAQARMSGLVVGALPFVMLLIFTLVRPDYSGLLFHDPMGRKMLGTAVTLDGLAFLVIRHMVNAN